MKYLVAAMLLAFLVNSAAAQMALPLPEHELLKISDSVFSELDPKINKAKCGDYLLYAGADSASPFVTFNLRRSPSDKNDYLMIVMQKRNIHVIIDNTKMVPTAEVVPGPKLILRINRADYEKSTRCLPRPPSA